MTECAVEPFGIREPLLLLSIGQTFQAGCDVYEAVRYAWRLDVERARRHDLVLAHAEGIVRGAYRPAEWMEATSENFPGRAPVPGRWGFRGAEAEPDVWDDYVDKSLPESCRAQGAANPVRYCEP